jgi:transposase
MDDYIGLDVSMKETAVSIRRGGKHVWRGKCASDPKLIAHLIQKRALSGQRNRREPCRGLAQLAEVRLFREVRMNAFDSMLTRTRLVRICTELSNQIRSLVAVQAAVSSTRR